MNTDSDDYLELLIALPLPWLCQVLAAFSTQQPVAEVWALLLWLELERERRPAELRPGARLRLQRKLFSGGSLARFLEPKAPFAAPVFEMVTSSVTKPLLRESSYIPPQEQLVTLLSSWALGTELADRATGWFLIQLPAPLLRVVIELAPTDFALSKLACSGNVASAQRAPFLLEAYLFLLHRGFLPLSSLINLHTSERSRNDARRIALGLFRFWLEISSLYRPSTH